MMIHMGLHLLILVAAGISYHQVVIVQSVSLLLKRKAKCYPIFVPILLHVDMLELVLALMQQLHIQSLDIYLHLESALL